jgi:transportin-1
MLGQAKSSPDITNYLTCILADPPTTLGLSAENLHLARTSAAITLKNIIPQKWPRLDQQQREFIQGSVLRCLEDSKMQVRNFAGNVITEIIKTGGVMGWPEVFPQLLNLASNASGNTPAAAQEGAMSALAKICEDNKKALDRNYQGSKPLDVIIPKLYDLTKSQNPKIRAMALESIIGFIPQKPVVLFSTIDQFMNVLFQLAPDTDDNVRRFVCKAFVQLVEVRPEVLLPHMQGLVTYLVQQQRGSDDPELRLEAAEFFLSAGEHKQLCAALGPYLSEIIPTLLESMVYSEDDVARLEGERDDAEEEDKEQDIKPQFAKSRNVGASSKSIDTAQSNGNGDGSNLADRDDLSEGEIEEDDEGDEDPEDEWNLRKCSAAGLDTLAVAFHEPVFVVSLPYLKQNLGHQEWPMREAAVLAIGAVSEGCMDTIAPHLPELLPFLLSCLSDKEPVVRKITCWALGRYTRWAMKEEHRKQYYEPVMEGLLKCMLDRNKSVQEGAASAFSNLEETSRIRIIPYIQPILQQFVACFSLYKDRNIYILYDCIQTLAEHVGPHLAKQENLEILMPALISRYQMVNDQSRELFPLLECLSYVATALGDAFSPYAVPVFARAINIVQQNLEQYLRVSNNEALDKPDKDCLITSLDLLSAIIGALPHEKSTELVSTSQPNMLSLLRFCLEDPNQDVRQSAYALLGDCASNIYAQLQPHLSSLLPVLIQQLNVDSMPDEEAEAAFAVVNNACWACGEIACHEKEALLPYLDKIFERLNTIVANENIPASVNENAAIALGRLGLWGSEELAPHLPEFAKTFLETIEPVEDTQEKSQALLGLNRTIIRNPEAMGESIVQYLHAAASYAHTKCHEEHAKESFHQVCYVATKH